MDDVQYENSIEIAVNHRRGTSLHGRGKVAGRAFCPSTLMALPRCALLPDLSAPEMPDRNGTVGSAR